MSNDKFQKDKSQPSELILQIGANEGQNLRVPLFNNRSTALGIQGIQVDSYEKAMAALEAIDTASAVISNRRLTYGSLQNRLEFAYNVVSIANKNLTKSESILRHANMAKELSKLKKDQVLLQSSQSMLAQINQMSQGILEILKWRNIHQRNEEPT